MPADNELKTLRISTSAFSASDSAEEFREVFGRNIMRIEMEPIAGAALEADMVLRSLPGLGMAVGRLSPMRNTHCSELIDSDDLVLVIMRSGFGSIEQNGRTTEVREGDVALAANGEPAIFTGHSPTHVVNLRLSRELLESNIIDLGKNLSAPVIENGPALQLLKGYAQILNDAQELASPELRRAVATQIHDLAALALGATRDAAEIATDRGVRAARLHEIKTYVSENLGRRDLSTATVAARQGITPRYVNMLFEIDGISFSKFVLVQRLARAHRMLSNPGLDAYAISAIAYKVGFSDLSYFNRSFRRRYGATPSDVRKAERQTGNG